MKANNNDCCVWRRTFTEERKGGETCTRSIESAAGDEIHRGREKRRRRKRKKRTRRKKKRWRKRGVREGGDRGRGRGGGGRDGEEEDKEEEEKEEARKKYVLTYSMYSQRRGSYASTKTWKIIVSMT